MKYLEKKFSVVVGSPEYSLHFSETFKKLPVRWCPVCDRKAEVLYEIREIRDEQTTSKIFWKCHWCHWSDYTIKEE
jgi:hypothetical protein